LKYPALLNLSTSPIPRASISRSGQAYSASDPQLRSLKGDAREFATWRIPQWPTNAETTSGCIYDSVVGPSYSPARRPPKKSLGRTRAERREGDGITGGGRLSARVFSTRCTVARYASLLVLHDRLNRIFVEVHPRYCRDVVPGNHPLK